MDILLDWEKCGVMIENKPWTIDQSRQLADYRSHLEKRFQGRYLIVYLTVDGHRPQGTSISTSELDDLEEAGKYLSITYHDEIKGWLEECVHQCQSEKYRWFLRDFIQYINYQL
jgi:hypothetical protein